MSNLQLSFIFFIRLESFLSCICLPVSKARTNKLCILRQCKYIKEKKLICESETNRNAFQQTYLVKPPQILQPVALLMFRVEAIPMFLLTVPIQICQVKLTSEVLLAVEFVEVLRGKFAEKHFC
jgi:hypothetical protein